MPPTCFTISDTLSFTASDKLSCCSPVDAPAGTTTAAAAAAGVASAARAASSACACRFCGSSLITAEKAASASTRRPSPRSACPLRASVCLPSVWAHIAELSSSATSSASSGEASAAVAVEARGERSNCEPRSYSVHAATRSPAA
eukprot:scaffold15100_cov61-Phaeocystis_antarctica.AAC.5